MSWLILSGMGRLFSAALGLLLLAGAPAATGKDLTDRLVEPGRGDGRMSALRDQMFEQLGVERRLVRFEGGPTQAYWLLPPLDFGLESDLEIRGHTLHFEFHTNFAPEGGARPAPAPERGSIVLLHGWGSDSTAMLPWAMALSGLGYRTVLVDLRNHGDSGTAPAGYGLREGEDLTHLVRKLRAAGELPRPLFLMGLSYGAVTAIVAAARLGNEIDGVVAMAPFDDATEAIHAIVDGVKQGGPSLKSRLVATVARARYDRLDVERAIDEAGRRLGLDLRALPIAEAMAAIPTCTLLLHGARDDLVPPAASARLARRNPRAVHVELPLDGHVSLAFRFGWLAEPLARWLEASVGAGADGDCPGLELPPDPLDGKRVASPAAAGAET